MSLELHALSCSVECQVSGDGGHLSAEPDSRAWGYNGGKTQFFDGDSCYFLVYKSSGVEIIGSACSSGVFSQSAATAGGDNIHREGITFSSPLAQASKPIPSGAKALYSKFDKCGGAEYLIDGVNLRLTSWESTGDPTKPAPYGFIFLEYTPKSEVWCLSGMNSIRNMVSTTIHGTLFGLVKATGSTKFSTL